MKRLFRNRAPALLAGFALALGVGLCARPAAADIIIFDDEGDFNAANPNAMQQIHFNGPDDIEGPAVTVRGHTVDSNDGVTFTANQGLVGGGAGNAFVQAATGEMHDPVLIQLEDPLLSFLAFSGELERVPGGPRNNTSALITGVNTDGTPYQDFVSVAGGNDFFGVLAINGQRIQTVSFFADPQGPGIHAIRHMEIGGIGTASAVPEPMSMALLAAGGLPLLGVLRRRRRREEETTA